MFNLVIVDDEDIILNGLSKYIKSHELNFNLVGAAHSIDETLEILDRYPVDVVLTDIHLEFESGLDLVATLSEDYPDIKTVILSGYEEFEYARRALRYGVFDFLSKPVSFDTFHKTFQRLYQALEMEVLNKQQHEQYISLRKSTLLNNLVKEESFVLDPILAYQLDIRLSSDSIQVVRFKLEHSPKITFTNAKKTLDQLIIKQFSVLPYYLSFSNTFNELTLVIYDCSETQLIDLLESLNNNLPFIVTIGISQILTDINMLYKGYFQAGKALEYKAITRNSSIIRFNQIQNTLYLENVISSELNISIMDCLLLKKVDTLIGIITQEIIRMSNYSNSLNLIYSFCIEFYLMVDNFLKTHHTSIINTEVHNIIKQLIFRENPEDIIQYTTSYIRSQQQYIEEVSPYSGDTISNAQNYIQEHFAENITLNTLAEFLFIHPIYLSKLFKEKTGQNFIDYLTYIRIEKAKKLLCDTSFKIYDISEMVGYESPKYFSKLFKEMVGDTPKLYRDHHSS